MKKFLLLFLLALSACEQKSHTRKVTQVVCGNELAALYGGIVKEYIRAGKTYYIWNLENEISVQENCEFTISFVDAKTTESDN